MQAFLIGSGAREHAIAEAIARDGGKLTALMGANNPGIARLASSFFIGKSDDMRLIHSIVEAHRPEIAIIGPESPLEAGVVDMLAKLGVPSVGPIKELARLETSKSFTRQLMHDHHIPGMPKWRSFDDVAQIPQFLDEMGDVVIKPDGLTGGKGVKVQGDHFLVKDEALSYCREVLFHHPRVVIEEKLEGEEFSVQFLVDGKHVIATPAVQDHKRVFESDKGPNTGGMGSYSCEDHKLPFLSSDDIVEAKLITEKMLKAMLDETGHEYKGIMYGGYMKTKHGVKLIEYNARFADPEAMNVLPIMESSFLDACHAIVDGNLHQSEIRFAPKATVCKYVVPNGYPENPVKGESIDISPSDARIYFASVDQRPEGIFLLGSRAVAFVGIGDTLEEAEEIAQRGVESVKGPVFYRRDIGTKALVQRRVDHMKQILG